jgi:pyruvate/2-oxoglutarate dehydrogenase complex dihydrolipoamide acyltransferase (E2) component
VAVAVESKMPHHEFFAYVEVIRQADQLSLSEIHLKLHHIAKAPEQNQNWKRYVETCRRFPSFFTSFFVRLPLHLPHIWLKFRGAAALISSPAKYGVDAVVASWAWPLGVSFGYVKERPVVKDGKIVPCSTFSLVLNFDRRIMAGAQAAIFFKRFQDLLENPKSLLGNDSDM